MISKADECAWMAWILACTLLVAACVSQPDASPEVSKDTNAGVEARAESSQSPGGLTEAEDEFALADDARSLYQQHCAGCHNDNGDGRGPTMLANQTQARSFAQGGFAFGNTREAIYKTITQGFPGYSVMPAFRDALNDEQRLRVAEYVLTLTPYQVEEVRGTQMQVGEFGAIARGKLPPIVEGRPERPRGLLIAEPGGMSFEFRSDDLRLLGVRQGAFADRRDWGDRGGDYLAPLGKLLLLNGDGDPLAAFAQSPGGPLRARLASTWSRASGVGLKYSLEADGLSIAEVHEHLRSQPLSVAGAFTRELEVDLLAPSSTLEWIVLQAAASPMPRAEEHGSDFVDAEQRARGHWFGWEEAGGWRCTLVVAPRARLRTGEALRLVCELDPRHDSRARMTATSLWIPAWDLATLRQLERELQP